MNNQENNEKVRILSQEEIDKIETFEEIGAGACAKIYKDGNEAYKIIKENAKGLYRVGSLEELANIKSSLCVFPKEILKDDNGSELGYKMDFVSGRKMKDIFTELSFAQLQQLLSNAELGIEDLSEQKIAFDDMHFDNMMWDEEHESIKIIDTDFFKFAEEIPTQRLNNSNQTKFNNQIETLIGIRDGTLATYLGRNEEYIQFYKEYFKRGLKGETLSSYELIDRIKSIAEKDLVTEFSNISQITEKAKDRVKEYKDEELDIENWSEGNEHLRNLLTSCRDNKVPSMFCCAGHGKGKPAYITIQKNEHTMGKIYSIMSHMEHVKDISLRFAQKELGQEPNFTVYMHNEKSKNEIMDMMSFAMTQEKEQDELPENFQMLTKIDDIFTKEEIGYDLEYTIGKNHNRLLLENLKYGHSKYLEKTDFKEMGFKSKKNMVGKTLYLKNGISKGKESNTLNNILENLKQIYDEDYERPEDFTLSQKLAQRISSNQFLSKMPFMNKFIKKQLYILPEKTQKQTKHNLTDKREKFSGELSNNGAYSELSKVKPIVKSEVEKSNTVIVEDDRIL